VVVAGGKPGITFLVDQSHLGKVEPPGDPNVLFWAKTNFGLWGSPAAYVGSDGNTYLFVPGSGPMTSWRVATTTRPKPSLVEVGQTPDQFGKGQDGGTIPVISSNGVLPGTAIVWAYSRADSPTDITLRAYDASNLAHELINIPFTRWVGGDSLITPMVANGMVYAGGNAVLNAYGLLSRLGDGLFWMAGAG
jgi:hypothetical protein